MNNYVYSTNNWEIITDEYKHDEFVYGKYDININFIAAMERVSTICLKTELNNNVKITYF